MNTTDGIVIEVGSRSKGYAVDASDVDLMRVTRCGVPEFIAHITGDARLKNAHRKDAEGNDVVDVDLFTALMGIYNGNYYNLGVFGEESHFEDKKLFAFVRRLTRKHINGVLTCMVRRRVRAQKSEERNRDPKQLLAIMHSLSYVEHWLSENDFPAKPRLPELLGESEQLQGLYNRLMECRRRGNLAATEDADFMDSWQRALRVRVDLLRSEAGDQADVKAIINYMLGQGELV